MSSQFLPYLESIRNTYAKWWQLYTLTDATGKQQQAKDVAPLFDFNLMVQTVRREERERQAEQREEQKVERLPVLEGMLKYAKEHVLLVGRPGSGKSTALARLLLEEATQQTTRIPVLVELRYWQGSIEQLILSSLTRHDLPLGIEQLEEVLSESLLLFDGVNELPSEEARSQLSAFRRNHPKLPIIFTTRELSLGGDLGIEKKLEMQPLTEAQMQAFIRSYVPEQAEQMLRQLKDRLREFGQTPLLLWMLCGLFQQTGQIPENLGMVFRSFTQGYERNLKQDVRIESDRAWWKPVLQQLAWVMMQGEKPTELRVAIRQEEAVRAIAQFLNGKVPYAEDFARKCLRDLQKYHLIQAGTNNEELEFRHQLIQEYYAAEALLEQLEQLGDERLQQEFLNFLKWTEPVALMLALVEDETQAVRIVELALVVDPGLGSRLAGEVQPEFQQKTVEFVTVLESPDWLRVWLLVVTRSDNAIPALLKLVENDDSNVRRRAVDALGEIGSETAISALLKLVGHADPYVHWNIADALAKIGSETTILSLLKLLEDTDSNVRWIIADALGKIGSEATISGLLKLLEDTSSGLRRRAAYALGEIGSETAIPGLLKLLKDTNSDVRQTALDALAKVGSETAIPGLLELLEDSDYYVRRRAAYALGEIGSETTIPGLLKLLEDTSSDLRRRAAYALGEIGSETAIPGLLKLLEDTDSGVRRSIADALGEIGSETAIPGLLKLLEDADHYVRRRAVDALGKIGSETAIPDLLKLLEDTDSDMRGSSAEVLGKVGSEKAIPSLLKLLEDADHYVRRRAVDALGKIGSEKAIPASQNLLNDNKSHVCSSSADVLDKTRSEKAISALLKLVEDDNPDMGSGAAYALGNVAKKCTDDITPHLPHLLTLIPTASGEDAHRVILAIQENCKYYNYEVFQAYLEAQKVDQVKKQNNDRSLNTIYNIERVGILQTGDTTIHGDQIGEQHNHP